jgi:DNA repair protein RecO (recombination protein O)
MKLESVGIIVELRPFGERDVIAKVFTQTYGILTGMFKAGQVSKSRPMVGQMGKVSWNARIESQLGSFHFENEKNLVADIFNDARALAEAGAAFALLAAMLPEREAYPNLYMDTLALAAGAFSYLDWEIRLLSELGYAMALEICGNCGRGDDLEFVSPKTARAICLSCGEPFREKLFKMPLTLDTTKYFLLQISDLPIARHLV